jgi:hypothetical protein
MRNTLMLASAALCLASCSRPSATSDTGPPRAVVSVDRIAGTYALVAIDGRAVPVAPVHPNTPPNAPPAPEVVASTLRVNANGEFTMDMSYRMTRDGAVRSFDNHFSGTCAPSGETFRMRWDGAGTTRLTPRGDTLLLNNEGMIFAYVKKS